MLAERTLAEWNELIAAEQIDPHCEARRDFMAAQIVAAIKDMKLTEGQLLHQPQDFMPFEEKEEKPMTADEIAAQTQRNAIAMFQGM